MSTAIDTRGENTLDAEIDPGEHNEPVWARGTWIDLSGVQIMHSQNCEWRYDLYEKSLEEFLLQSLILVHPEAQESSSPLEKSLAPGTK